jgi:hypothetical protein
MFQTAGAPVSLHTAQAAVVGRIRKRQCRLLPFMHPTTLDTAYFGGIDNSICT